MCLNQKNVKQIQNFKISWKSNWFVTNSFNYKKHIYEDIFIRKYISSFFFKWSKFSNFKVLGSIYLFRTFGKLYINIYFFCPLIKVQKVKFIKKKTKLKQLVKFSEVVIKPVSKCKKYLNAIIFFYKLERILGIQIFFKFRNICNALVVSKLSSFTVLKISTLFLSKFSYFKYQFKEQIYYNTITCLVHLFKFKNPDGLLLANYISSVVPYLHKHTYFLMFLKRILQVLQKVFKFTGVKIILSGKLNGFSRAQVKQIQVGSVSLQSFNIPYVEGYSHSFTGAGKIGVKVWIC